MDGPGSTPEVAEPRRPKFGIADCVLDRAVSQPILNCRGIMHGIGRIHSHAAALEGETSAFA